MEIFISKFELDILNEIGFGKQELIETRKKYDKIDEFGENKCEKINVSNTIHDKLYKFFNILRVLPNFLQNIIIINLVIVFILHIIYKKDKTSKDRESQPF